MRIFVSWSGKLSHRVALLLKDWFPNVIQAVRLYVSSEDINKGTRWLTNVSSELENSQFGIICITRENINSPWLLFEAGALSKRTDQSCVNPLLIDLLPSDLSQSPLGQFQATSTSKAEIRKLVMTVNNSLGDLRLEESKIDKAFNKWWPDLEKGLSEAISIAARINEKEEKRSEREILEKVLEAVLSLHKSVLETKVIGTTTDSSIFIQELRSGLENRRKPFLIMALDGAKKLSVEDNELYVEYTLESKHIRDVLAKPDNIRLLREVCREVTGHDVNVRIVVKETDDALTAKEDESRLERERLRKLAEQNPLVQQVLRTFRAEIIDVRHVKP